jgi:hypothetical protein
VFRDLIGDKASTMPYDPEAAEVTALRVWHCDYVSLTPVMQYLSMDIDDDRELARVHPTGIQNPAGLAAPVAEVVAQSWMPGSQLRQRS